MNDARRLRVSRYALAAFTAVMCPAPAHAHLNSTGMGPLYDGSMHFVTSPEDLAPTLALALFAGLRGARYGREALFALPSAWLAGGLLGLTASAMNGNAIFSAIWFLLLGGLLAADAKLSLRAAFALAVLVGLYHGYLNGSGMGQSGFAAVALLGLVFAVFVLVALTAAFVVRLRAEWTRIGVRVAGSWIASVGLLLLGWAARSG
jgi:hydrogenase/urease accessory protein HupE